MALADSALLDLLVQLKLTDVPDRVPVTTKDLCLKSSVPPGSLARPSRRKFDWGRSAAILSPMPPLGFQPCTKSHFGQWAEICGPMLKRGPSVSLLGAAVGYPLLHLSVLIGGGAGGLRSSLPFG